jgi:VCBS repeat protein/type IX secretion system substrate protein
MFKVHFSILAFLLSIASLVEAQPFVQKFDSIPFIINSVNSVSPFNGGLDIPRFQMVDIDGDGRLDLFTFDKDTTLNFYRNEGSTQNAVFRVVTTRFQNLPLKNWFYFANLDADGDYDLLAGGDSSHIRYFLNTGSATNPVFVLQSYAIRSDSNTAIAAEQISNHHVTDINADGKLDLFLGSSLGTITYYQNIGTPQNFLFHFVTSMFAGIQIIGGGNNFDSHGANSVIFFDVDGDNDFDLTWGDYFQPSIYYIKNTGSASNFQWTAIDSTWPHPIPWFSVGFNMPRYCDIDNDGLKDLFVGVLLGSQTRNNFIYYKNNGPLNNPMFTKITENYIPNPDVGANGFPVFTDIDNDNDYDLFIGSDHSTVSFYRNTGTQVSPSFTLVTDSLPIISSGYNYAPSFGDLDGDGKKDMVLGSFFQGKLRFFKNTGTLQNPVFNFQPSQLDTFIYGISQSSTPALVDIDNDGKLDLFVGHWDGKVSYYHNNGTVAVFNFALVSSFYNSIDVGDESNLCFSDIDHDGDLDMFIGRRDGRITFYRNTGTTGNPNFILVTNNYENIYVYSNSVPAFVDIDNDTDKDLFLGNIKGGMYFFDNREVIGIKPISTEVPESFKLHQNYPNPFNPVTKIRFDVPLELRASVIELKIYDILGRQIAIPVNERLKPGTYQIEFNGENLSSGVYIYALTAGDFSASNRMVLLK